MFSICSSLSTTRMEKAQMARPNELVDQLILCAEKGDLVRVKELIENERAPLDGLNTRRECALHVAVRRGRTECVRYLVMQNAALDIPDADGSWPIHLAARSAHHEIVAILLRKKRHHVNILNPQRESPLHLAANWADVETVRVLLDYNADATFPGYKGLTALHIASMRGKVDIAAELLGCGAQISSIDDTGKTALHHAAFCPNPRITSFLIDRGADTDALDHIGASAIHWACASGYADVTRVLLQAGAEPSLKTNKGNTPLHLAAKEGHALCVAVLLEAGVYSDIMNQSRETPLDLAHRFHHADVARLLSTNPNPSPGNQSKAQANADRIYYTDETKQLPMGSTRSLKLESSARSVEPSVKLMSKAEVVISTKPNVVVPDISLPDYFTEAIEKYKDKAALVDLSSGYQLTFRQLSVGIRRVAAGLYEHGLCYRQSVCLLAPNIPESLVVLHAATYLGATLSPIDPTWSSKQIAYQLAQTRCCILVTTVELLRTALAACDTVQSVSKVFVIGSEDSFENQNVIPFSSLCQPGKLFPETKMIYRKDIAFAPFKSGKFEPPKCIEFTHHNLIAQMVQGTSYEDIHEDDVVFASIPFHHVVGFIYQAHVTLLKGATLLLSPDVTISTLLSAIEDKSVTRIFTIPPILRGIMANPDSKRRRLTSINHIYCGGASLPVDLAAEASRFFRCYIRQLYGTSESGVVMSDLGDYNTIPVTSIGQLLPNMECKIVNQDGQLQKADQHGEICVRGPQVFSSFKGQSSGPILDPHGWFRTGDVGYYDSQGYFYFVGTQREITQKRTNLPSDITTQLKLEKAVLKETNVTANTITTSNVQAKTAAKPKVKTDAHLAKDAKPDIIAADSVSKKPAKLEETHTKKSVPKTKSPYSKATDSDEYSDDEDFRKPLEIKAPPPSRQAHQVSKQLDTKVARESNSRSLPIAPPAVFPVQTQSHPDDQIPVGDDEQNQKQAALKTRKVPSAVPLDVVQAPAAPVQKESPSKSQLHSQSEEKDLQPYPIQPPNTYPSFDKHPANSAPVEPSQPEPSVQSTIHALFDLTAFHCPNYEAVRYENRRLSFAMLSERSNKLVNAFTRIGLKRSQRVVVISKNSDYYIEIIIAAAKAGLVLVPINNLYPEDDVKLIVQNCDAAAIFVGEEHVQNIVKIREDITFVKNIIVIDGVPPPRMLSYEEMIRVSSADNLPSTVTDHDVAWQLYTSGTTGIPKGCMLTHGSIIGALQSLVQDIPVSPQDISLVVCNLFSPNNLMFALMTLIQGGSVIVLREFASQKVISALNDGTVKHLFLMPPMIQYLTKVPSLENHRFPSIRNIIYTSSGLPVEVMRKAKTLFPSSSFTQIFGQVESCGLISLLRSHEHNTETKDARRILRSCGSAALGYQVRVIDENGQDVEPGDVGEIVVYGPGIMKGYYKKPNETAQAVRGGWLYTGDMGTLNEEGRIHVIDRKCDVVKINGSNVYPREIEEFLFTNRGISDAAVTGYYDLKQGQILKAYVVVSNPKLTSDEIISFCKQSLPSNKIPKAVQIVPSLPKNAAGKIMKRLLAQIAATQSPPSSPRTKK